MFPTVVGPRYIPGTPVLRSDRWPAGRSPDTDVVSDASKITPPVLGAQETTAHRIDFDLKVAPGRTIRDITSVSHAIEVSKAGKQEARVRLSAGDDHLADRDFVLRVDVRGKAPEVGVEAHREDEREGFVAVTVQPPAQLRAEDVLPRDLVFVLDASGSMDGAPLQSCKTFVRQALQEVRAQDRFTVFTFSDVVSGSGSTPVPATPHNVAGALAFMDGIRGEGGTNMEAGIQAALGGSTEPGRVRVVFFLTDGYVGDDARILRAVVNDNPSRARIFALGVGSSVNRYLLSSMARLGRGEVHYLRADQPVQPVVDALVTRVRAPVLTDITMLWDGVTITDLEPARVPDLFAGQPLRVLGRYRGAGTGTLTVRGLAGQRPFEHSVEVTLPAKAHRPELGVLWARQKVERLNDEESIRPGSQEQDITDLGMSFGLLTRYTAFVAVDHERTVRPNHAPLIPVAQRLPLPQGVSRRAVGELSRRAIPPGDPILTVAAPPDARRVTAYFPFGLVKDLAFDARRNAWRVRFLVPEGIPDGVYTITVVVELKDGAMLQRREPFVLDGEAPELDAWLTRDVIGLGETMELQVETTEPAAEVYLDAPSLHLKRVPLGAHTRGGRLNWGLLHTLGHELPVGDHDLLVVVRDAAGNQAERALVLRVLPQ